MDGAHSASATTAELTATACTRPGSASAREFQNTTVGIVGTGLIGSSIGLALRRVHIEVLGVDDDPEHLAQALELGAVDVGADLADLDACDVVVVAVPPAAPA